MQWLEEIPFRRELACPDVPAIRVIRRPMPQSIDRDLAESLKRDCQL
jgi:hypothetical protein